MALDPGTLAIIQARRNYSTRAPAPNAGNPLIGPPDPIDPPPPVVVPPPATMSAAGMDALRQRYGTHNFGLRNYRNRDGSVRNTAPPPAANTMPWNPANPAGQMPQQNYFGTVNAQVPASGAPAPSDELVPGGTLGRGGTLQRLGAL